MRPATAYQIVHDEVSMDGNARFNLATFVTTWMEPEASLLMAESFQKNMIDKDEYPLTAEIEKRWTSGTPPTRTTPSARPRSYRRWPACSRGWR